MHIHLFQSTGANSDELMMCFAQEFHEYIQSAQADPVLPMTLLPSAQSLSQHTSSIISTATATLSHMLNLANVLNSEGKCNAKYCSVCQSHSYVKDQILKKRESTHIYFCPNYSIGKKIQKIHMMYIFLCFVRNIPNRSSYFSPMQVKGFISRRNKWWSTKPLWTSWNEWRWRKFSMCYWYVSNEPFAEVYHWKDVQSRKQTAAT